MLYTVQHLTKLSNNIYRVILQPPTENYIRYQAGQYIEILAGAGTQPARPFSIANAPLNNNHVIELHLLHARDNPYMVDLLAEIKTQRQLYIRGPLGKCTLHKQPPLPLLLLAGGAGIVPFKALIEQALADKTTQPIHLYWGARYITDFYLQDLIMSWTKQIANFHYIPVLSGKNEAALWTGRTGWVHEAVLADQVDIANFHIYASGPVEMVNATFQAFKARGLKRELFYSDMMEND